MRMSLSSLTFIFIKYVSFSKKRVLNRVLLAVRGKNGGQFHVWEIEPFGFASRMVDFGDFEFFRGPPYDAPSRIDGGALKMDTDSGSGQ